MPSTLGVSRSPDLNLNSPAYFDTLYINFNVGRLIASHPSLGQAAVIVLASVNNGVDTPDGATGSSRGESVPRSVYEARTFFFSARHPSSRVEYTAINSSGNVIE